MVAEEQHPAYSHHGSNRFPSNPKTHTHIDLHITTHTHVQKHPLQLFIDLEGGWRQLVAGSSENKEKRTTSTERGDEEISGIKGSVRHDGEAAVRSAVLVFNCGGRTSTRNDHNGYLPGSPIDLHYLRPLQTSMAVLVGRKSKRIWWEELLNQNTASDDRKKRRIDM